MAINYSMDAEAQIVRLTYVREPTVGELTATMRAIFRGVDYRPGFGFLVDRRAIEPPKREFVEGLLGFMALQREALAGGRWAVVVSDMASYGMGRMGELMSEAPRAPVPVRPFLATAEAEAWLRETAPQLPESAMLAPVPQPSAPRRSRRVLVIEDDSDSLAALTAILEHAGHRVRSALDGQSGVDLAQTFLPEVLVVDIRLPDTDGFDVARAVKSDPTLSGCYVIAVTGMKLTPGTKTSAVDEYFVKPVDSETLLAAVDRAS